VIRVTPLCLEIGRVHLDFVPYWTERSEREATMKTRFVLALTALILIASLSSAPAYAKPTCAHAFPIMLGVGY
jgi:hypothetical protein